MHYIVAVPYDLSIAESIGKKGSENGIIFFNRKEEGNTIVCLVPSNPEDKFHSVAETLMLADQIILNTNNVDAAFGEVLVAAKLLKKKVIFTGENDVGALAKGIDHEISERDMLVEKIIRYQPKSISAENDTKTVVLIDKVFPVKGVGTVALGLVKNGVVHAHDTLYHNSGKEVFIRSIQSQDVDIDKAGVGTRVGLALKNIEYDEIDKGDVLSTEKIGSTDEISAKLELTDVWGEDIAEGRRYEMVSNFIACDAEVKSFDGKTNTISLSLVRKVPLAKGDFFVLLRSRMPRIFAIGEVL
ncbi:MAG: EF-Tu/IF-2/RF-3 family GTPase [Candidatus Micrarchaeia archaeon]